MLQSLEEQRPRHTSKVGIPSVDGQQMHAEFSLLRAVCRFKGIDSNCQGQPVSRIGDVVRDSAS
jgi:hypothetical protein